MQLRPRMKRVQSYCIVTLLVRVVENHRPPKSGWRWGKMSNEYVSRKKFLAVGKDLAGLSRRKEPANSFCRLLSLSGHHHEKVVPNDQLCISDLSRCQSNTSSRDANIAQ
jgi:hypothetical protein